MKEYLFLRLLDLSSNFFYKIGIDYKILRRILQIKLTEDDRRTLVVTNQYRDNSENNSFLKMLIIYFMMGLLMSTLLLIPKISLFFKMSLFMGIFSIIIMAIIISDFSNILLDNRDKNILLFRPIDSVTINTVKILHVLFYVTKIVFAIVLPALIIGSVEYGFFFLITFLIELIFNTIFILFFTCILYTLLFKFLIRKNIKDVVVLFQIILSVVFMLYFQLIANVFHYNSDFQIYGWRYILPPVWFSSPFKLILGGKQDLPYIVCSILGIIIPLVLVTLYLKKISAYLERNIQVMVNSNEVKRNEKRTIKLFHLISKAFFRDEIEYSFFYFTKSMLSSDKKIRIGVYPSLIFCVFVPFMVMYSDLKNSASISDAFIIIHSGKYYLALYMTIAMSSITVVLLNYAEAHKGSWIYKVLPLESYGSMFKGVYKGYIFKIIMPIYLIFTLVFTFIYGPKFIIDMILIILNGMIVSMVCFRISQRSFPFIREFKSGSSKNIGVGLISIALSLTFGLIHAIVGLIKYGVLSNILFSLVVFLILWFASFDKYPQTNN